MRKALALLLCWLFTWPAHASLCPEPKDLPLLTIHEVEESAVPVFDRWQVMWNGVALSDAQLAKLYGHTDLIKRTHDEMSDRGLWVYTGLATAAVGVATSAAGWTMLGRGSKGDEVSMSIALGGMLVSVVGVLLMTETIQRSAEAHIGPTPRHRITREEMRGIVAQINNTLYGQICGAVLMAGE